MGHYTDNRYWNESIGAWDFEKPTMDLESQLNELERKNKILMESLDYIHKHALCKDRDLILNKCISAKQLVG